MWENLGVAVEFGGTPFAGCGASVTKIRVSQWNLGAPLLPGAWLCANIVVWILLSPDHQFEPKPYYTGAVRMLMSTRCPGVALTGCPGPRQGIDSTAAHSTPGAWILLNLAPHLPGTNVPRGPCGGRARRRPAFSEVWRDSGGGADERRPQPGPRDLQPPAFPY